MIEGLKTNGFPVFSIVNAHSLGRKIEKAKNIANINQRALSFVEKFADAHRKFSVLINDFDHALNKMYPPYLSTSFVDMKKLNDAIETIVY